MKLARIISNSIRLPMRISAPRIVSKLPSIADLLWRRRRAIAFGAVVILHVVLILAILHALRPQTRELQAREMILSLSPGGPRVVRGAPPIPDMAAPAEAVITPPEIEIADVPTPDAITLPLATGGPAVTVPAEAMGDFHSAPALPGEMLAVARHATLRLLLTVASDGSISKAAVETSSGLAALDSLVIAWVTAHWRYRPAMQDGHAVSVTTTAIVPF